MGTRHLIAVYKNGVHKFEMLTDWFWTCRSRVMCFFGHHKIARRRCTACGEFLGVIDAND